MDAARCFDTDLHRHGLCPDVRLYRELKRACCLPFKRHQGLRERLIRGAAVLDKHPDDDELWDRWETIFVAYHCCQQAIEADEEEGYDANQNRAAEAAARDRGPILRF